MGPSEIDFSEGLAAAVGDASGPIFGALSALFAFFIVFNYLDLPANAVTPVVTHDVVLVVVSQSPGGRYLADGCRPRWSHRAGAIVAGLVLSNILLATWLQRETFYTNYVLIVVVGTAR